MRQLNKLDADKIGKIEKPGLYSDGLGLWLQVRAYRRKGDKPDDPHSLSKTWIFRYRVGSKSRYMGLGAFPIVTIGAARKKAAAMRQALEGNGLEPRVDLIAVKHAARAAAVAEERKVTTFRQAAERYIKAHEATWKNPKHAAQWPATLETYAYPFIGDLSVAAIDTGLILKVLEQDTVGKGGATGSLWAQKPETASRVRGRIETILDWATVRGYRKGENPARWKGHLDKTLPAKTKVRKVEGHAALPYSEIGDFMVRLRAQNGVSARALEATILTAARTGEVIGARWPEIDLKGGLWTIPAERMKAGRAHTIPLSKAVIAVLEPLHKARSDDEGFVFPGAKGAGLSNMSMAELLKRMGVSNDRATIHGFRSTFRTWAADRTNFARNVAEAALSHTLGDKVEAAYNRGDLLAKRRQLMDAWARFCATPGAAAGDNVSAISAVRR